MHSPPFVHAQEYHWSDIPRTNVGPEQSGCVLRGILHQRYAPQVPFCWLRAPSPGYYEPKPARAISKTWAPEI